MDVQNFIPDDNIGTRKTTDSWIQSTLGIALREIAFGSVAGMLGKLVEHPFDIIKVRLQSQPLDQPLKFKSPLECFKYTIKTDGLLGLYQGVSMPLVGAMLETATLFVVYNRLHPYSDEWFKNAPLMSHITCGAIAGACASFVLTPVELVKCKLQVQSLVNPEKQGDSQVANASHRKPETATSITRSIIQKDGFRGLWTGQLGTFIRESGGTAAWFTTFELISDAFLHREKRHRHNPELTRGELPAWQLGVSGASAGIAYNVILYPADSIKSRMQTANELLGPNYQRLSFIETGAEILRTRGLRGLYQGCFVNSLRSMPSSGMVFILYNKMENYFSKKNNPIEL